MSTESKPNTDPSPGGVSPWLKSNLMGLGSAAVLAVYAAGFERTRAAAARFNAETEARRSAAPMRTTGEVHAPTPRSPDTTSAAAPNESPAPAAAHDAPRAAAPSVPSPKPRVTVPTTGSPSQEPSPPASSETRPVEPTVPPTAPVSAPVRDSAPAKPAEVAPPPKAAPVAADTAQAEKEPVRKDGTYSGWGTSRHGDIQATIQIKNGKIVFAAISECLTRYPCSWIAALPGQVLARQSADVDFVSGATQSANAFYSAVVEALNKAK